MKPLQDRTKPVDWPFAFDGAERPKLTVRTLGGIELGMADASTGAHFEALKNKQPKSKRDTWEPTVAQRRHRDRAEVIHLAYVDDCGRRIGNVDEIEAMAPGVVDKLYLEWQRFQDELGVSPLNKEEMEGLVEELKKNIPEGLLLAWPSSWLIELIRTLVDQLPPSTPASSDG
jgi:hypothetical protein